MDFRIFFRFFIKYAYLKYVFIILVVLFFRFGLGFTFFSKTILFEIILALFIYDLPTFFNFKHWEANKVIRYRDLIEIFTSIFSILYKSYSKSTMNYNGDSTEEYERLQNKINYLATNVGYFTPEDIREVTKLLDKLADNEEYVNFNIVKLCNKDFQALQHIHAPSFENFCCDEKLKEDFLLMVSNITKMERDVDLILNLDDKSQQLNCIDNFHLQVRNICDEVNIFYSDFFYEVEKNIPLNKERYIKHVFGGI